MPRSLPRPQNFEQMPLGVLGWRRHIRRRQRASPPASKCGSRTSPSGPLLQTSSSSHAIPFRDTWWLVEECKIARLNLRLRLRVPRSTRQLVQGTSRRFARAQVQRQPASTARPLGHVRSSRRRATRANSPSQLRLNRNGQITPSCVDRRLRALTPRSTVPVNPLSERGYPSIGCWPCTRPVAEGEDRRGGRWAGNSKTECGLHV